MYFYSQGDKQNQSPFTNLATFFVEKFPLAFGGQAIFYDDKNRSSETKLIKVEYAAKLEYTFEEDDQ